MNILHVKSIDLTQILCVRFDGKTNFKKTARNRQKP